jgi:Predicted membrane protein (DUF2142)
MRQRPLAMLIIGWLLLGVAWVFGNPPFAAPDEADHYVRTVGIAEGQLVGSPAPDARIGATPAEISFDKSTQRAVVVPARLNPTPFNCYLADPRMPAGCLDRPAATGAPVRLVTSVGSYPPVGLLAPAAVVSAADNPRDAVRLGRLAGISFALALLIAAAVALFQPGRGWLSLAGVLAACTPTAIFLAASLTPSGLSVSAGIALTASLLRIGRADSAPRWVWVLFGVSAAALALSHPTGIAWALLLVGGFVALGGISATRNLVRRQLRVAWPGLSVFAAGVLSSLVWQVVYGPSTPVTHRAIRLALSLAPDQYWRGVRDLVAGFGYLEFRLPLAVYLLWGAFVGTLAVAAVRVGERRERRSVIAAGALAVLVPVGVWIVFARGAGIGLNGREYMPVLVAFPILAGEIVNRNRARLSTALAGTLAALASTAGVLHFIAWYLNGRRAAVGTSGNLLFPSHAQWNPPLGWAMWVTVAGCGALILAAASVRATRHQARSFYQRRLRLRT